MALEKRVRASAPLAADPELLTAMIAHWIYELAVIVYRLATGEPAGPDPLPATRLRPCLSDFLGALAVR